MALPNRRPHTRTPNRDLKAEPKRASVISPIVISPIVLGSIFLGAFLVHSSCHTIRPRHSSSAGPGSFHQPHNIVSRRGVLETDLYVQFAKAKVSGATNNRGEPVREIWTRAYSHKPADPRNPLNEIPGPTLVFHPGNWLQVNFHNQLNETANPWLRNFQSNIPPGSQDDIEELVPHEVNIPHNANNTNLHVHGLHVDPKQDNVTLLVIPEDNNPSMLSPDLQRLVPDIDRWWQWKYGYRIPGDHLPGTHWYHAHKHGSTSTHVENGMAGTLVIRPENESEAIVPGLWHDDPRRTHDRVFVLQEIANYGVQQGPAKALQRPDLEISSQSSDTDTLTTDWPDITVNGRHKPTLDLSPGQTERWRFVDAGANHRTASYLWVGALNLPEDIPLELRQELEAIRDFRSAKPYLTIGGNKNFTKPFEIGIGRFPGTVKLAAIDGVTLSQSVTVTPDRPVLVGPGNRADLFVQADPEAQGKYYICKNFNVAPPRSILAEHPAYGDLFRGEPGYWRYQALSTADGGTDVVNGMGTPYTSSFEKYTKYANLSGDPFNLGATFTGFKKNWPKQVDVSGTPQDTGKETSLAPILVGKEESVGVSITPASGKDYSFPGLGWTPTGNGGGLVDAQVLVTVNVSGPAVESPPIPSDARLNRLSPTTSDPSRTLLKKMEPNGELRRGIPSYVSPIADADIAGRQVIVFDKAGVSFTYQPPTDEKPTSMNQFSLNGRQFSVMDFVGNPYAPRLIRKALPASVSNPYVKTGILGTYKFNGARNFTNQVTIGDRTAAFITNPGYYVPVVEKDGLFNYDYSNVDSGPTYPQVTGLSKPAQPEATTAEEWLLVNNSRIFHPFHIHISPFLVKEVGQLNYDTGKESWGIRRLKPRDPMGWVLENWWDVIIIPPHGYVKIRLWLNIPEQTPADKTDPNSDFIVRENANVYGSWVYHCHILRHEDRGMMMLVNVKPKPVGSSD